MRAKTLFLLAFGAALVLLLVAFAATAILHARGRLTQNDAETVLRLTRDGVLPLAFIGLGALSWHLVRFYRGDYARR